MNTKLQEIKLPEMHYRVLVYSDGHGSFQLANEKWSDIGLVALFENKNQMTRILVELINPFTHTIVLKFIPM
jgi:hypothetical protein